KSIPGRVRDIIGNVFWHEPAANSTILEGAVLNRRYQCGAASAVFTRRECPGRIACGLSDDCVGITIPEITIQKLCFHCPEAPTQTKLEADDCILNWTVVNLVCEPAVVDRVSVPVIRSICSAKCVWQFRSSHRRYTAENSHCYRRSDDDLHPRLNGQR